MTNKMNNLLRLSESICLTKDGLSKLLNYLNTHGCTIDKEYMDLFVDKDNYECILDAWNTHCGHLHKVNILNQARKSQMRARWSEVPDREKWEIAAKIIAKSDFHTGSNDRGWVANFEYFLRPMTIVNCLEGVFSKKQGDFW